MTTKLIDIYGPPSPEQARRILALLRLTPAHRVAKQTVEEPKPAEQQAPAA